MHDTKRRLSVGAKIGIVASMFMLPIGVLLYLVVANIGEFIAFGQLEVMGNLYQRPLEAALSGVQDYQVVRRGCPDGSGDCAGKIDAARGRVEQAFDALSSADRQVGAQLQFTDDGLGKRDRAHLRVETVRGEWNKIGGSAAPAGQVPADVDARLDHLVTDLRGMITHAGDTSNLILDPDLDSYYLMDVTLLALPQTQDRLARVVSLGRSALQRGSVTPGEATALAVQAALLEEADLVRIKGSTDTSLKEDANFYGVSPSLQRNLPPALQEYSSATEQLIALTRKIAADGPPSVSPDVYVATGLAAHGASFKLWDVGVNELDQLLAARIASYQSRRSWSLALAGLALLVACVLAYLVTRSITTPLKKLVRMLAPGAVLLSQCVERISQASQAETVSPQETAVICDELEAHAQDMRLSVSELESVVDGGVVAVSSPSASDGSATARQLAHA